ncbi:MAG: host specificity factor TipJ family phage tail protein [Defluviicoccus sp.]|nr:host specificity factor TipJ family phage tail protein [Defluviicoccus sp.]
MEPLTPGRALVAAPPRPRSLTADLWPHPLTSEGRRIETGIVPPGATLADLVARHRAELGPEIAAAVDGREVAERDWARTPLGEGQIVALRPLAGGGNVFRTLLLIAVLVAAIYVPPALNLVGFEAAALSAGISIAGGLIVNALFPIRPPALPGAPEQGEPVYSLAGGANRARLYEPLPLVLGEHRVFPDLAAREFTENFGDDQYLHAIYHFGLGDLDISDIRVGSTPIGDFEDVETEIGAAIALFPGNVDTIAGAALETTDWVARVTAADTARIGVDLHARLFRIDRKGETVAHAVSVDIEWSAPGLAPERRTIPLRSDSQSLHRVTETIVLPQAGVWTVRVRRTTVRSEDDKIYDEVSWAALRAYQPDRADYAGQTRMGIRIRASGQLSGRLDRVSALVKQKIPTWDGARWTANRASSNPAALFRWYARGIRVRNRLVAGVGLPAARIDEAALQAWYAWCEAQGLRCDFVLDREMPHERVLQLIAQCGRASTTWQSGRLGAVWEEADRPATALVHPGNIVAGSFAVDYVSGATAEEVVVRYIEPGLDWQFSSVRRTVPGVVGAPASSVTVTARGVTGRDQAAKECNLQVARQHYHRRRLKWEMPAEGLRIARGDVVWITHALIDGGLTGRLRGGSAGRVLLDRAVRAGAGAHLLLRLPDGALHRTPARPPEGAAEESRVLVLDEPLPMAPGADGGVPPDTLWRLYDGDLPPQKARVIAVEPVSDRRVRFVAIDELDAYHALATGDLTAPFPDVPDRTPRILGVTFAAERVAVGSGHATELQAALTVKGDWRGGVVRAGPDFDTLRTVDVLGPGETVARWRIPADAGQAVEIVPGSEAAPAGPRWRGTWRLDIRPPPDPPTNFRVGVHEDGTRVYAWTPSPWPDLAGTAIRYAAAADAAWAGMTPLHEGLLTASPLESLEPPEGTWTFAARSRSTSGADSAEIRVTAELGPQRRGEAQWHFGAGPPAAALGRDGDFYVDTAATAIWTRAAGVWTLRADLSGADGAAWHPGSGAPRAALGVDGDWYFDRADATIWRKAAGAWAELLDIGTGRWHSGSGPPANNLGAVGDFFFRTDNGYVYEKTGSAAWSFLRDITGPQGLAGLTWHTGNGVPAAFLGRNGELYFRHDNATVWQKTAGAWRKIADLAGADGAAWHPGEGEPAAGLGADGDWYFDRTEAAIWRKAAGAWTELLDIGGGTWHSGTGAPAGDLGKVGDFYFRDANGYVYEKTAAATWTFRRDITGPQGPRGAVGPRGPEAALLDGSVQTGHLALGAVGGVYAQSTGTDRTLTAGWSTILSVSVPGARGYRILAQGVAGFSSARPPRGNLGVSARLRVGETSVASGSAGGRAGSSLDQTIPLTAARAHASTRTVELQVSGDGIGNVYPKVAAASLLVFLAKR